VGYCDSRSVRMQSQHFSSHNTPSIMDNGLTIYLDDRFLSIGCPGRPFATTDPTIDDLLPSNDTLWDQGVSRSTFLTLY
jgi:hypothetical protein